LKAQEKVMCNKAKLQEFVEKREADGPLLALS